MWNVLAWTMLPFPSVDDFILQKDIPVFCRNVIFFSPPDWEVITDWIKWLMSQLVTDYFFINLVRLELQVLRHIPEIAVALVSRCIVNATNYISYTLPIWEADKYVVCLTPVLKYVPKQNYITMKGLSFIRDKTGTIFCARSRMFMCTLFCLYTVQQHINTGS